MSVLLLLILASLALGLVFLGSFIWAVRSGQFEDTATPPLRILFEDSGRARERLEESLEIHQSAKKKRSAEL